MRVSLIGPGDTRFHFHELMKFSDEDLNKEIYQIAEALDKSKAELVILPDRGICFEVAKKYKELGGKKVIGTVPKNDRDFGISHLRPYIEACVEGKKLIDEFIDTHDWYKQDATHILYGDCVVLLGKNLGSLGELTLGFYIYKLISKNRESFGSCIRAGKHMPFTLIVYLPFVKDKLDYETETYIKKSGGRIAYAKDAAELEKILMILARESCAKKR